MSTDSAGLRKTIVITGASDGIGAAAARALNRQGAQVVVVGRSPTKTAAVAREIDAPFHITDFASLAQVRALAADLLAAYPRIDVLANNAGFLANERTLTEDGHEATFQVNHLAPFLLTNLLKERLVAAQASVITTSSAANRVGNIKLDDLESARGYNAFMVYGTSKLENILFTKELARRWGSQGIRAAAFHPGLVATQFGSADRGLFRLFYHTPLKNLFLISSEQGADTLIWLAGSQAGRDWQSGEYYVKRKARGANGQAYDATLASALWDRSVKLVGLG